MPESGPVVGALTAALLRLPEDVPFDHPVLDCLRGALSQAREQEELLREYMESHQAKLSEAAQVLSVRSPELCHCSLCERTRKVLPS